MSRIQAVNSNILLEAGTNEVEVLVFHIGSERYAVNVAKVREVMNCPDLTVVPEQHSSLDGVARVREAVVPVVNLQRELGIAAAQQEDDNDRLMLLEFNQQLIAFRVNNVERIYRISWKETLPLPEMVGNEAPVVSLILLDGNIVPLLDFETIAAQVGLTQVRPGKKAGAVKKAIKTAERPIVFAEDSKLIFTMLEEALEQAGYSNCHGFRDGQSTWDHLNDLARDASPETIRDRVSIVVSDIEMPRLDGLGLTRRIREHAVLKDIPVVLFSSLVSADNEKKGRQVGATAQVCKPKWDELTAILIEQLNDLA